jgi:hypothetical protein
MSWFGHTLLPVIQDAFMDRLWESDPVKAAGIVREGGCDQVANFIERMTPESWLEACHLACVFDAE